MAEITKNNELPTPLQVDFKANSIFLNGGHERIFTIKNHKGDWGAVKGQWVGYKAPRKGIPGTSSTKGTPGSKGNPGYLNLQVYHNKDQLIPPPTKSGNSENYNYKVQKITSTLGLS